MPAPCPLSSTTDLRASLLSKYGKGTYRERRHQRVAQCAWSGRPGSAPSSPGSSVSSVDAIPVSDAVAIIAGTSIGGGFLALPSLTTPMGFMPAMTGLFVSWAFLALAAMAYAEATMRSIVQQNAARSMDPGMAEAATDDAAEISVLTVTRCSLGNGCSMICSLAFATQMFVVMTAQVVKCGEIISVLSGLPYVACCILPSVVVGCFSFSAGKRSVEHTNSFLTAALVGGFAALIFNTTAASIGSTEISVVIGRLAFADWQWLLPSAAMWSLPVFINLLCFGQSVPVVVGRLGADRPRDIHAAILIGSFIPFVLCAIWTAVSAALLDPSSSAVRSADPVLQMLTGRLAVAVPVGLVAMGAIGTTLIANYLSLGQFATDAICAIHGRCSPFSKGLARTATVVLPLLLACSGPELYLPLLAFAGAYPTNLLYGLMPPLAVIVLRRLQQNQKTRAWKGPTSLLPGGDPLLLAVASLAAAELAICAALSCGWTP